MSDRERELDASLEAAAATVKESERLAGEAERSQRASAEWKKANNIDAALERKFFDALTPEDRKKVQDEQEAFDRELAHDLEAAIQRAAPAKTKSAGGKRTRNMA